MDGEIGRRMKQTGESGDKEAERGLSLLLLMLRFTKTSYEAICFLLSTEDISPKRKNEFALILAVSFRVCVQDKRYRALQQFHDSIGTSGLQIPLKEATPCEA
jgi:hypothetical protein